MWNFLSLSVGCLRIVGNVEQCLTTIYVTDERPLTLRQRLAKAIDTGILYIAGLNLAVALFVYLLGRPSVAGYLANFLQRCMFC